MRLWDLENRRAPRKLPQHGGIARSVTFTPDGRHAIAAVNAETEDDSSAIYLWDLERDVDTRRFQKSQLVVTSLAISPDGQRLLTTSYDGTIRLWDIGSGRQLSHLTDHKEWVWSVAFSPRGDFAVSAGGGNGSLAGAVGRDFALRLWDLSMGGEIKGENGRSRSD